jgi:hypothetical protein
VSSAAPSGLSSLISSSSSKYLVYTPCCPGIPMAGNLYLSYSSLSGPCTYSLPSIIPLIYNPGTGLWTSASYPQPSYASIVSLTFNFACGVSSPGTFTGTINCVYATGTDATGASSSSCYLISLGWVQLPMGNTSVTCFGNVMNSPVVTQ